MRLLVMSSKTQKNKNYKNTKNKKNAPIKKGLSKKAKIAIICAAIAVIIATVVIIVVCNSPENLDTAPIKASLTKAGYSVGSYVPEAKGYVGVTETISATYAKPASDSLADYLNAKKEQVCFIVFDNIENAKKAFEDFRIKWGGNYQVCKISGNAIYFGTKVAVETAFKVAE